ncbi:MAG: hypothetical protein V2I43_17830 [Parvularcula sp.]|jgi:hypothetical protein|nr:hypothetical protein [Parvularcula sp.]
MKKWLLSATAFTLAAATPAFADHHNEKMTKTKTADDRMLIERQGDDAQVSDRAISGSELLNASLTDGFDPVGSIDDVILNEEGKIAFIKYETSRVRDLTEEGYLAAGDMDLRPTNGFNVDVSLNNIDTDKPQKTMRLSETEQQSRMLSNILRDQITTAEGNYDVRDVVFSPSGQAEYIIAAKNSGGFLSSGDAWAIPFDQVSYSDGAWRTIDSEIDMVVIAFNN